MEISRRNLMLGATAVPLATALAAPAFARPASPAPAMIGGMFGPKEGIARLGLNENPYGPSAKARLAAEAATAKGAYYADTATGVLTKMIAEKYGVRPEQVVIGTGSGEVLNAIALAWKPKGAYLGAELFWDTTAKWAVKLGATLKTVPMTAGMEVDLPGIAAAVDDSIGLVHIVNPNNPTGLLIDGNALRGFIKTVAPKKTVLIDEAYNELVVDPDYSSMIDMVRAEHDVIITRTFSKIYGMAGMRIGYAITTPANATLIRGYMMTSLNAAGLAAAIASFEDESFKSFSKAKIIEAREMIKASAKSAGLEVLTPAANFAFVKVADANAVQKAMAAKGVLIRGAYGKWTTWSRVSTGRIEDVERYCKALPEAVGA